MRLRSDTPPLPMLHSSSVYRLFYELQTRWLPTDAVALYPVPDAAYWESWARRPWGPWVLTSPSAVT